MAEESPKGTVYSDGSGCVIAVLIVILYFGLSTAFTEVNQKLDRIEKAVETKSTNKEQP